MLSGQSQSLRPRGRDAGLGLSDSGAVIVVDNLGDQLPGFDRLVVLRWYGSDVSGHLGGQGCDGPPVDRRRRWIAIRLSPPNDSSG